MEGNDRPQAAGQRPEAGGGRGPGAGDPGATGPFALRILEGRNGAYHGHGEGPPEKSYAARVRASRGQPLLPIFGPPSKQAAAAPPRPEPIPPAAAVAADRGPPASPAGPPGVASGEKAKARDILAAIRTLQRIEGEHRPATAEERQALARFGGFGAVALSLFPDPITGRYKDAGWQALGDELASLLTTEEYDSAKRTTFNAFYTSPTVISAMHRAVRRLGVPEGATVLEPGCGTGNFMGQAPAGMKFIGVELDGISGRIARALHPGQDIRVENFRDTQLPLVA